MTAIIPGESSVAKIDKLLNDDFSKVFDLTKKVKMTRAACGIKGMYDENYIGSIQLYVPSIDAATVIIRLDERRYVVRVVIAQIGVEKDFRFNDMLTLKEALEYAVSFVYTGPSSKSESKGDTKTAKQETPLGFHVTQHVPILPASDGFKAPEPKPESPKPKPVEQKRPVSTIIPPNINGNNVVLKTIHLPEFKDIVDQTGQYRPLIRKRTLYNPDTETSETKDVPVGFVIYIKGKRIQRLNVWIDADRDNEMHSGMFVQINDSTEIKLYSTVDELRNVIHELVKSLL